MADLSTPTESLRKLVAVCREIHRVASYFECEEGFARVPTYLLRQLSSDAGLLAAYPDVDALIRGIRNAALEEAAEAVERVAWIGREMAGEIRALKEGTSGERNLTG